jgi:transcriptional regulator of acetoin/glycerol metabolism
VRAAREWSRSYAGTPASRSRLRNDAQTYLIHLRWPGDTATAAEVLDRLALEASAAIRTRLALTEEEELLMDVQIPRPDAAPADGNRAALIASSLANARLQGAQVSCFPSEDARFTTLRALLYATGGPTGCREGPAMADEFLNDPQS